MCYSGPYAAFKIWTTIIISAAVLILVIVMLSLSIKTVAQDEWALNYGKTTRHVRGQVMGPGRYTVQPDSQLFTYKNTFTPFELEIDCWTLDGLEVSLTINIQTRYISEEIEDILFEFGDEESFAPYISNVIKKLMRETCSNYTSFDYYSQRGVIQSSMLERIDTHLPLLGTHLSTGGFLQLTNIKLPDAFNQAILDKRSAEQDILVAQNQRAEQIIIANTNLNSNINQGTILINNANLLANAIRFDAEQQAIAIAAKFQQRLLVYSTAMNNLQMTADDYIATILANRLISGPTSETTIFV